VNTRCDQLLNHHSLFFSIFALKVILNEKNMQKLNAVSIILLLVLSVIWGSSFILMKMGLTAYSWDQVAALRISISGIIFIPYVLLQLKKIRKFHWILLFALLEVGFPPFLYTYAQTHVDSSTAGILNSLVPLFTLVTGVIIFSVRTDIYKVLGVLIGLIGALLLVTFSHGEGLSFSLSNPYGLLVVLATFMYGLAGNILKEKLEDVPSIHITAVSFSSLGILALIYLFTTDFINVRLSVYENQIALLAIIVLSVFGSALAIILFNILIKRSTALFASFVTYLIPFVALFWGFLDGENITYIYIVGLILILFGISLTYFGKKQ
jgi:drug/metabolite transporter (DMT)-like permease